MTSTVLSLGGWVGGEKLKLMLSQPSIAGTGLSWNWGWAWQKEKNKRKEWWKKLFKTPWIISWLYVTAQFPWLCKFLCSEKNDESYRVSRKTLYTFYFAITKLMMHQGFSSWSFSNSPFPWLLEIVQNFKDGAIFDQVMKEILTETQNKKQQICIIF